LLIAAVDAHYTTNCRAGVACVTFSDWSASDPENEIAILVSPIEPYSSGNFWRRELPCISRVLDQLIQAPDIVLIDGYVWLDGNCRKGLGAYLYEALDRRTAIVGVAKSPFQGASGAAIVTRGRSGNALFVTSAGLPLDVAVESVKAMAGSFRIPALLRCVDRLARETCATAKLTKTKNLD